MTALHHKVQRVLVRAIFDPTFAVLLCDPARRPADVEPEVAEFFHGLDARALDTDAMRCSRVLQAMLEDYRISATMAVAETRTFAVLEGFFASRSFAIAAERGSTLALAFGDYLLDRVGHGVLKENCISDIIGLERAQVAAKSAAPRPAYCESDNVRLTSGVSLLAVDAHIGPVCDAVRAYLERVSIFPQFVLAEDAPTLAYPKRAGEGSIVYLTVPGRTADDSDLIELSDEAHAVVRVIMQLAGDTIVVAQSQIITAGVRSGVAADQVQSIILELLDCGAINGLVPTSA